MLSIAQLNRHGSYHLSLRTSVFRDFSDRSKAQRSASHACSDYHSLYVKLYVHFDHWISSDLLAAQVTQGEAVELCSGDWCAVRWCVQDREMLAQEGDAGKLGAQSWDTCSLVQC